MRSGIAGAMFRKHRWSYAGLAVMLVAATAVVGSSLILFDTAQAPSVELQGLSANAMAKLAVLMDSARSISRIMAIIAAFVAVMLVTQAMNFIVDGRRRDFALLRLSGASPLQTTGIVLKESIILGVASSLAGAILALPLAAPYAELLSEQKNWPPEYPVTIRPSVLIWCVVIMTVVTIVGALAAAWRSGRAAPIEAVHSVPTIRKDMSPMRWVLAVIGFATTVVFLWIPPEVFSYSVATVGVGAGAVLLVYSLAPLIVPAISRSFGGVIALVAPGAGLVAKEHANHNARRTAALATPILILLGLGAVFGMMVQTGRSEKAFGLNALTNVDVVVEFGNQSPGSDAVRSAADLPLIEKISQVQRVDSWAWHAPQEATDDYYPLIIGIDPNTLTRFVPINVLAGRIDSLSGTAVAAFEGFGEIGDTFQLETPDGTTLTVSVVAVVEPTSFLDGTFLINSDEVLIESGTSADTWIVQAVPGASATSVIDSLSELVPYGRALTHRAWVEDSVDQSISNAQGAILTTIGGAAILALISLAQSTLASIRERRDELELLSKLGASRCSVIGSVTVEAGIVAITASFLAILVTGLVYARMAFVLQATNSLLSPSIPLDILSLILAICVLVSLVTAGGVTALVIQSTRRRE